MTSHVDTPKSKAEVVTMRYILSFLLLSLSLLSGYAQKKTKVFVAETGSGPEPVLSFEGAADPLISNMLRSAFVGELRKLKSVELVKNREEATYVVSVYGYSYDGGIPFSGKVTTRDGGAVAEFQETWSRKRDPLTGTSRDTVIRDVVRALEKQLKWK